MPLHTVNAIERYRQVLAGFAPPGAPRAAPLPPAPPPPDPEWPVLLRPLKLAARPGDRGLGDVVVHVIGDARSDAFQAWFAATFKRPCGCKDRQAWLNRRFPLPPQPGAAGAGKKGD